MVIVFLHCTTIWRQEFSVIVFGLRNITMCRTLIVIVTYEGVEDKLHSFLTSVLCSYGCSP
jgi:hypothetical protein